MRLGLNEKSARMTSTCSARDQSTSAATGAASRAVGGSGREAQPTRTKARNASGDIRGTAIIASSLLRVRTSVGQAQAKAKENLSPAYPTPSVPASRKRTRSVARDPDLGDERR